MTPDVLLAARSTATAASTAASGRPLGGHLWHFIEAAVTFVVAIGAVAIVEAIQKHRRDTERPGFEIAEPIPLFSDRPSPRGGGVATLERPRTASAPVTVLRTPRREVLLPLMALASVAAAAVHFVVMPDHFEESALYGSFFLVLAIAQVAYSLVLLRSPRTSLLVGGAASSLAVVALWIVTRTVGIPLGPATGAVEPFGALDTLASGFELIVAGCAIALLARRALPRPCLHPSTWSRWIWAAAPVVAFAIAVTSVVSPPS